VRPGRGAAGFTLLEVLVALAILGVAVVASIQGFAQGLRLLKLAGDHQRATLLADQKAREVVAAVEGREDGTEGAFAWERTITAVPAPDLVNAAGISTWRVFDIDVRVRWDERRLVELRTMRTVNVVPDGAAAPTGSSPQGTATGAQSGGTAAPGVGTGGSGGGVGTTPSPGGTVSGPFRGPSPPTRR
jgi:general secretion pathway protein I